METKKINVLVVEDSPVMRLLLAHLINNDPHLHVMGTANDGLEAVAFLAQQKPDVILMDIHMPRMDGFEATRHIMETRPLPIVICSGTINPKEVTITFQTLEAGAVAFIEKPIGMGHPDFEEKTANLLQTIKLMSEVKVIRRWPGARRAPATPPATALQRAPASIKLVAIGASTGGPPVLQTILAGLPKDFPVPILIVQHIAPGFLAGLTEWLQQTTHFRIAIARHGALLEPGHVYLAPDDLHLGIDGGMRICLSKADPDNGLRPSVAHLFRSVAEICGPCAIGVILSGMGRDGAAELKLMKERGAVTVAQDEESCVIHGMPGEAIRLGAATHVLTPESLAATLAGWAKMGCSAWQRSSGGNSPAYSESPRQNQ